jgi:hypothetical protein
MAGKLQIERISPHGVRKVWFMSKQYGGLTMGNSTQRFIYAGLTREHIVYAGYPESGPCASHVKGVIS